MKLSEQWEVYAKAQMPGIDPMDPMYQGRREGFYAGAGVTILAILDGVEKTNPDSLEKTADNILALRKEICDFAEYRLDDLG